MAPSQSLQIVCLGSGVARGFKSMFSVIRYSQIVGLVAIDSATATHLGEVQEVWVDDSGRIVYLSSTQGYLPLMQIAGVSTQAMSTYGRLAVSPPSTLRRLHRLAVQSALHEPIGWIEDFLFDWQTGEITAYILAGEVTESMGGRAVLAPNDIQEITAETVVLEDGAPNRLRSEAEGLKGFLSEERHQVRQLVHELGDRLHELISPHDQPEVVRVKIKTVGDEMAASGHDDHHTLREAIDFLHDQWESLQHHIRRASTRAQTALESAWKHLTGKPS